MDFIRDGSGRIIEIPTPNKGSIKYACNVSGDLTDVTNQIECFVFARAGEIEYSALPTTACHLSNEFSETGREP